VRVGTDEKFAACFLSRCAVGLDLPDDGEIDDGVRVSQTLAVGLGEYWPEQLGTLTMEEIRETGLVLYVTAPAANPRLVDSENDALKRRLDNVLNSLLVCGVPSFGKGFVFIGANVGGEIDVRTYGSVAPLWATAGLPDFVVGMSELRRAVKLNRRLQQIQTAQDGRWGRLRRGVNTLLKANKEPNSYGDRLHQLVRTAEALIRPRVGHSQYDFAHRGQTFAVPSAETQKILLHLYELRSHVEHLHDPMERLQGSRDERIGMVNLRTRQADVLARFAVGHVLDSDSLCEAFSSDDRIDQFWSLNDHERAARWGDRVDVCCVA
jgi:hypothetical protein